LHINVTLFFISNIIYLISLLYLIVYYFPSNCFAGVVCTCWHQKVAAVIDEFPLELRDKYLFCIRYIHIFSENSIFRMQYLSHKDGSMNWNPNKLWCLYFISFNLFSYFLTDTYNIQSSWHGWWDFISRPDTGN
jgi:hypothetical protein